MTAHTSPQYAGLRVMDAQAKIAALLDAATDPVNARRAYAAACQLEREAAAMANDMHIILTGKERL